MKTRTSAVVLHIVTSLRSSSSGSLVIMRADQPYTCAAPGLLVGLYGGLAHYDVLSVEPSNASTASRHRVKIQVRPGFDPVVSRSRIDGLRGMRCFDAANARRDVKSMMGELYRHVVETSTTHSSQSSVAADDYWHRPESYMCDFPLVASEIFRRLPELDAMIAFTRINGEVKRVGLVPIAKLEDIAEWGEEDSGDSEIIVRDVTNRRTVDIRLPKRTYPLPMALRAIVGRDRHEKGDHPLRKEHIHAV